MHAVPGSAGEGVVPRLVLQTHKVHRHPKLSVAFSCCAMRTWWLVADTAASSWNCDAQDAGGARPCPVAVFAATDSTDIFAEAPARGWGRSQAPRRCLSGPCRACRAAPTAGPRPLGSRVAAGARVVPGAHPRKSIEFGGLRGAGALLLEAARVVVVGQRCPGRPRRCAFGVRTAPSCASSGRGPC